MPRDLLAQPTQRRDLLEERGFAPSRPEEEEESLFTRSAKSIGAGIAAFGNQAADLAVGTLDLAAAGVGAVGSVLPDVVGDYIEEDAAALRQRIAANKAAREQVMEELGEEYPVSTTIGTLGGMAGTMVGGGRLGMMAARKVAPGLAANIGRMSTAEKARALGTTYGYLDYAPDQEQRLVKAGTLGLLGTIPVSGRAGYLKGKELYQKYKGPVNKYKKYLSKAAKAAAYLKGF